MFKYLFLFALILTPSFADAVWFDSSWPNRVKVEVVRTQVGTTSPVVNFPVMNDCGGFPAGFWTNAQSDGDDIRVVESDEITETAFELVSFDATAKKCELHFMADSLATTSTSTFYIHYGNPSASAYASSSTYGANNVWTGYQSVWHLSTTTGAAGGDLIASGVDSIAAKVGNGYDFGGVLQDDYLQSVNDAPTTLNTWTASAWVKADTSINYAGVFSKLSTTRNGAGANQNIILVSHNDGTFGANPGGSWVFSDAAGITTNTWYRYTWVRSGSTVAYYVNGVARGTDAYANTNNAGFKFFIGSWNSTVSDYRLDGIMDEVRFKQTADDLAWVKTEFNNQNSTSTFFVIGAQETNGGPTTETFTTPGSTNWTAPANVSQVFVQCWGAGGGGGDATNNGAGGGGGGAYAAATTSVTAGNVYTLTIGTGGSGAVSTAASGTAGTASSFATTTVVAAGGAAGGAGAGGPGGSVAASTGDVEFAGGNGGNPLTTDDTGGGGGGAAGPAGAGGNGGDGTATIGGAGGTANGGATAGGIAVTTTYTAASNGTSASTGGSGGGGGDNGTRGGDAGGPGGGGGGAELNATAGDGDGGNGQCLLTYTPSAGGGGGSPASSTPDMIDFSAIFPRRQAALL